MRVKLHEIARILANAATGRCLIPNRGQYLAALSSLEAKSVRELDLQETGHQGVYRVVEAIVKVLESGPWNQGR